MMKLWGRQHRPFPDGLTKTVAWELLFVTFSEIAWFSELWDCFFPILGGGSPVTKTESSLLFFSGLPVFQVVCRPSCVPIDCSVSCLCIYHLLSFCTGFFAWPVNSSCCSTQVCPQNSQIGSCFSCLSSNPSFYSRLNILFLHVLQEVSFVALIYSVLPFWILCLFLWN